MLAVLSAAAMASPMTCDTAIVGGGPGGIYTAMRLAESSKSNVCVFEKRRRVGGRILTVGGLGEKQDIVVDGGAYRFARFMTADNQDTTCV
jgi:ribulose 1,5-bisphosphate synthetase/thiazole synthase